MGYRIDPGEPTDAELRRVLAEQLGRAADGLRTDGGPDAEGLHDVRKRLKKARSVLRLGRADLGASVVRHANAELRRVGTDLAQQRDADSLVEAVDGLMPPDGGGPTDGPGTVTGAPPVPAPGADEAEALAAVRSALAERADQVRGQGGLARSTVIGAARTLEQTVVWLQLVPPRATGWDALAPGFARQYHRGRKVFHDLPDEPTVDGLHEWRKRVKDLWYHQRLLRRLWTEAQRPMVAAADDLAATLGEDHDLGLLLAHLTPPADGEGRDHDISGHQTGHPEAAGLRATVQPVAALELDDEVRRLAAGVVGSRRQELQAHARRRGALLYADEPKAWRDRHGAWWQAARSPA